MPKYRNDGSQYHQIEDTNGNIVPVGPGETIETYRIYDLSSLTKLSDAPRWNPVLAVDALSSTGVGDDQSVNVAAGAEKIELINRSGVSVTVFLGTAANAPGITLPGWSRKSLAGFRGRVAQLALQFADAVDDGVVVTQYGDAGFAADLIARHAFWKPIEGLTQDDGAQEINVAESVPLKNWQLQVEIYTTATGETAVPSAGTLTVAAQTPGAGRAVQVGTVDLTAGDQIYVIEDPVVVATLELTPVGLDADKSYNVIAAAS